jgi:small subunit ribosomal protein S18
LAEYQNNRGAGPAEGSGGNQRSAAGGRASGPQRREGRRPVKLCQFCLDKTKAIDYKDTTRLRHCVSERGRILARRRTGTCAKHQRMVARAVKRARHIALLPYTAVHVREQTT